MYIWYAVISGNHKYMYWDVSWFSDKIWRNINQPLFLDDAMYPFSVPGMESKMATVALEWRM